MLQEIITKTNSILEQQKTVIIAVCGGSCTRKSSLISAALVNHFKDNCVLISQDKFQYQPAYINHMHPEYRLDHPNNFGIPRCYEALTKLKSNQTVEIPNYNFKKEEAITYKTITAAPIIIFEGLYAHYQELQQLNDISIYVKSPWYARLIRRIYRNTLDRYKGREIDSILESFCTSVTKAHIQFVKSQESDADFVIETPLQMKNIIEYYNLKPISDNLNDYKKFFVIQLLPDLEFEIVYSSSRIYIGLIIFQNSIYAQFSMPPTLAYQLKNMDWFAC